MGLASAGQENVWLLRLIDEISHKVSGTCKIYENNQSAIAMAKNPQCHGKGKHIAIKNHFVRELVDGGSVQIAYIPTEDMVADIFTKGLPADKFNKFRSLLGVLSV